MGRRCTDCTNAWQRHNAATNPRTQRSRLAAQLRHRYGMSLAQWDEMIERQGGACAICSHVPDGSRGKKDIRLHVDHDHVSNAVRSLLCHQCNLLIGHAKECPERLRKAADYVARLHLIELENPQDHK